MGQRARSSELEAGRIWGEAASDGGVEERAGTRVKGPLEAEAHLGCARGRGQAMIICGPAAVPRPRMRSPCVLVCSLTVMTRTNVDTQWRDLSEGEAEPNSSRVACTHVTRAWPPTGRYGAAAEGDDGPSAVQTAASAALAAYSANQEAVASAAESSTQ